MSALDVDGAAVLTLGKPMGSDVVAATDETSAKLGEVEVDLGEGPGWETLGTRAPVRAVDLRKRPEESWPLTWQAFQELDVGSVFAFPLIVGSIDVGAVTLYRRAPTPLTDEQVADGGLLARILARQLLHRSLLDARKAEEDSGGGDRDFSRREVHQATGMVLAQLRIPPDEALLVIRGHAFATGRSVLDVATDIIARVLDFTPTTD